MQDSWLVKMLHQVDLSVTCNQQPVCFSSSSKMSHNLKMYKNKTRREDITKNKYYLYKYKNLFSNVL